jgi:DNA-binding NarL/FixJ family response regulator
MDSTNNVIKVGVVDDHIAITRAFGLLLNNMNGLSCVLEAISGEQLLCMLESAGEMPDIILMDVDMKEMNGIEATKQVTALYPLIKVIAFTGVGAERTITQMIGAGACAYLMKHASPDQIEAAIKEVHLKSKYHADVCHLYAAEIRRYSHEIKNLSFTENEKRFLQLLCKGYSYKEMAENMNYSIRSIDYCYGSISQKLNTKSQVVMALEALRLGIVTLDNEI